MKTKDTLIPIGLLISFMAMINGANSAPIYYPANGHYYEVVQGKITWDNAKIAAESRVYLGAKGHLATITSQDENDFVFDLAQQYAPPGWSLFLGGFQPSGSPESAGNWQWVTGEPWSYENWHKGEPSNGYGGDEGIHPPGWPENVIEMWGDNGQWYDYPNDVPRPYRSGYIVEYPIFTGPPVGTPAFSPLGLVILTGLLGLVGVGMRRR